MKRTIVWFKTDLRLSDNETLVRAIEQSDEIIPIYCFDESHFKTNEFGFKKTGNFRANFLIESIADLDTNLRAIGSGLVIVNGKPEVELVELVKKYEVQRVFAKKEVAFEEIQTQGLVEKELWKVHCSLETYSTSTLYHAEDLPFSLKYIPDVFTNFRKQVEKESTIRKVFAKPKAIKSPPIEQYKLPSMEDLDFEKPKLDLRSAFSFKGGETEGNKRLNAYFFKTKAISSY